MDSGPSGLVVGVAILRDGRVLAARRTRPAAAAGRWELPGGKVEPGETPEAALVREVGEELGCTVQIHGWLTGETAISPTLRLRVAWARLVDGEPAPHEHDAARWLSAAELDDVDWLDSDRPFLVEVGRLLADDPRVRAIFFDEDGAREVARRLVTDGYDAAVARERFAGEDDDQDHPWAVVTDAPALLVERLVDERDGWLDTDDEPPAAAAAPLDLPAAPRRITRPVTGELRSDP